MSDEPLTSNQSTEKVCLKPEGWPKGSLSSKKRVCEACGKPENRANVDGHEVRGWACQCGVIIERLTAELGELRPAVYSNKVQAQEILELRATLKMREARCRLMYERIDRLQAAHDQMVRHHLQMHGVKALPLDSRLGSEMNATESHVVDDNVAVCLERDTEAQHSSYRAGEPMHPIAVWKIVDSVQRRAAQGDCPTEPPQSLETLEEVVLELAVQVQHLRITLDPDEEPSAGGGPP